MCVNDYISDVLHFFSNLGLQHGVITTSQPYGLGLNETLLPEYLNKVGYSSHIVGKVRTLSN